MLAYLAIQPKKRLTVTAQTPLTVPVSLSLSDINATTVQEIKLKVFPVDQSTAVKAWEEPVAAGRWG